MVLIFILAGLCTCAAQNPIVPAGVYLADPSAHVGRDGKMYVYGSKDESPDYYCSWSLDVFSSADLIHWERNENVFASKGNSDQIDYSDERIFAPDCLYKDGTYFLYYCLAGGSNNEGVATSSSPTGPFTNARVIRQFGKPQIDPCVFVDDDGQAYYLWGQFSARVAKLKPNLLEIDSTTIKDSVITEKEHFFHEGGYMIKRNGIYYFIYADIQRGNMPTCIGYATGKSPMGPFKYGGVIIDNNHCDPGNWNNHGSLVEMNGKWYVVYHRATHNSNTMRKACLEPITFNADGNIDEVEMTSQGVAGPLNAFSTIEAERACLLFGNVRIQDHSKNNDELGGIENKDRVAYKYVDFGVGAKGFEVSVSSCTKGGKIEVIPDQPWNRPIGSVNVPAGNPTMWSTVSCPVSALQGVHALWLRFSCAPDEHFAIDSFKFN